MEEEETTYLRYAVIKDHYVINVLVVEEGSAWEAPATPHDLLVQDTGMGVGVGDRYNAEQDVFYRPLTTPPDWPEELTG